VVGAMATERTGPDAGCGERLDAIEARMEHLEKALEGLQDALYRQMQLEEENIDKLRKRIEPSQLARDLSRDARERGL
jgi:uncharacterized coiled-coil protein SlyX